MASSIAMFAAILYASFALGHPNPIKRNNVPTNLGVTWYQSPLTFTETTTSDSACGLPVSQGQFNTTQCYVLHTDALGIQQDSQHDCVLKVWNGVSDCSGNENWTSYAVPTGHSKTCIETGILDGGSFQHKSCILSCS